MARRQLDFATASTQLPCVTPLLSQVHNGQAFLFEVFQLVTARGVVPLPRTDTSTRPLITCRCFGDPDDESKSILEGFGTTYQETAAQAFALNPRADKESQL